MLLMINKKRGYKSSRKVNADDEGKIIDGMDIARKLYDEDLTPGQYVLNLMRTGKRYIPDFYRSDLIAEFNKIWNFQKQFYPEILTDELKEELLNQESITADIIDIKINEKNNEVILSCDVYDSYYCNSNYEKFKIDVKVELGKTTIFANDENILEKIKKLAENKETIFVTPEKNSYKNETIVAKNIEVMGC